MLLFQLFFDLNYYQIHKPCPQAVLGEAKGFMAPGLVLLVVRKDPAPKNKEIKNRKKDYFF